MTLAERLQQPDVAGLPDWRAADVLNAPDVANGMKSVDVDVAAVESLLLNTMEWANVVLGAEPGGGKTLDARKACINLMRLVERRGQIGTSSPGTIGTVGAALAELASEQNQIIAPSTAAALIAMTTAPMSWAEANNIQVDARAVGLARGARA